MGMFLKRIMLVALIGLLVLTTVGCSANRVKGNIAATVNGVEISMEKFDDLVDRMKSGYEAQGFSFTGEQGAAYLEHVRKEAINTLVQQEAIVQEARSLGYEVSQEEIDAEYNQIKEEFSSEEEFLSALEANNLTESKFKEMLAEELLISKFIENEVEEINITEEKIREVYDDYVANVEAYNEEIVDEEKKMDIPSFEELKEDIREFLKNQNQQEQASKLIQSVVEKSDIEIFI